MKNESNHMKSIELESVLTSKWAVGMAIAGICAAVIWPLPRPLVGSSPFGVTAAQAQEGGHDGGNHDGGQGGQSGHGAGKGGQGGHSGGKGGHDGGEGGSLTEGEGGHVGGSGGGGMSATNLGRLNMARALLSPGFDETKIDDPEAPLMQIVAYRDFMKAGVESTWKAAAQALANAATAPISVATVNKLNSLLGTRYNYDVPIEDFAAYAQSLNKNEEH